MSKQAYVAQRMLDHRTGPHTVVNDSQSERTNQQHVRCWVDIKQTKITKRHDVFPPFLSLIYDPGWWIMPNAVRQFDDLYR